MNIKCNQFATKKPSCRFYAFPKDKPRVKVHVDGKVDFNSVQKSFKDKKITVSLVELKAAATIGAEVAEKAAKVVAARAAAKAAVK